MLKILLFLFLIVVGTIVSVNADTFESTDSKNYLFLEIDNNKVNGLLQIDGKITSINDNIKYYKNGNFMIKLFDDNLLLYGSFDNLKVTVRDLTQKQKIHYSIVPLDTSSYEKIIQKELTPLDKFHQAQNQTGLGDIAKQNRLEEKRLEDMEKERKLQEIANKTPRNQYQRIDNLELVVRSDFHVPLMTTFNFDLRTIDQNYNKYSQFYGGHYLEDVEITGKIINPDGKVKKIIQGSTDKEGYFDGVPLFMPVNTPLKQEWSLEISGIKYFDSIEKFSTFSTVKPFFAVVNPSMIAESIDIYPPTGTITILSISGTTSNISPDLELTCDDYGKNNILIDDGCSKMSFSLDGNFTSSKIYDFEEEFTFPGELEEGENIIYTQFTDDSLQENVSIEEISDSVLYCEEPKKPEPIMPEMCLSNTFPLCEILDTGCWVCQCEVMIIAP